MGLAADYYAEHDLMAGCDRCGDRGLVDFDCDCLRMCDCVPTPCQDCERGKEAAE